MAADFDSPNRVGEQAMTDPSTALNVNCSTFILVNIGSSPKNTIGNEDATQSAIGET